ncbi:hypothetical protein [uncultured Ferrovibrio sp.]|jgi:hypothetical protein|uniref:hypothetical protein n=1 Tax=uncultured Ferrovibrio sp. TaxID=1576913 RepID=UPI0026077D6E|nr:hypothetical protein [uncultured Ferrovibrio sp.]
MQKPPSGGFAPASEEDWVVTCDAFYKGALPIAQQFSFVNYNDMLATTRQLVVASISLSKCQAMLAIENAAFFSKVLLSLCCKIGLRNMTSTPPVNPLEVKLLQELSRIEARIAELESEKRVLQKLLVKVRQEDLLNKDVARKNSYERIVVENSILQQLKSAGRPLHASTLFQEAKDVSYALKDSTFRSYLHRLKLRGQIVSAGRGIWQLPETAAAAQVTHSKVQAA